LLESKQTGCAPFKAIEAVISWEDFTLCIAEADQLEQLATVNRLAQANELPETIITDSGLKITPLDSVLLRAFAIQKIPNCTYLKMVKNSPL
jgi:hypothetical protein